MGPSRLSGATCDKSMKIRDGPGDPGPPARRGARGPQGVGHRVRAQVGQQLSVLVPGAD